MPEIVLGRKADHVRIAVIPRSRQSFGLAWKTPDGEPADLSGQSFVIIVASREWVADNADNVSRWTLTATDSDLALGQYGGRLVIRQSGVDDYVAFDATVVVS